ncbi:hypothetical protein F5Y17DRAFT_454323 [Xylariaceae sp. FL0594]|nr:hypothetical protein F5Y17DRAFT_454323 [Xylariaceae sp. FL0594]
MLSAVGLLFLTSFGSLVAADEIRCWAPDGMTLADNETVVPCNKLGIQQAGVHSSCCRLDGDEKQRDLCTTAGLCLSTLDGVLRREYCTDKTWKSPACVNVCTDPKNGGLANGPVEMTACSDGTGTYCCGEKNLECCGTDRAIVIPTQGSVVVSSPSDNNSSKPAKNSFKAATIALAVILGVFTITFLTTIVRLEKKRKSAETQLHEKTSLLNDQERQHQQQQQQQQQILNHHPTPSPSPAILVPYQDYGGSPSNPGYKDAASSLHAPASPPPPPHAYEMNSQATTHRYSELDAGVAPPRSEMSSPGPGLHSTYEGMGSPRSNDGFPR